MTWKVSDRGAPSRTPSFDGSVQAVYVALLLREEIVISGKVKFLLTGQMNTTKNLFSQICSKGRHRYNPSSKDFRYAYLNLSCQMLLVCVSSANCSSSTEPLLSTLMRLSTMAATEPDMCAIRVGSSCALTVGSSYAITFNSSCAITDHSSCAFTVRNTSFLSQTFTVM